MTTSTVTTARAPAADVLRATATATPSAPPLWRSGALLAIIGAGWLAAVYAVGGKVSIIGVGVAIIATYMVLSVVNIIVRVLLRRSFIEVMDRVGNCLIISSLASIVVVAIYVVGAMVLKTMP